MSETLPNWFTIRVYALIVSDRNEVLVTDEFQLDTKMTKFPGGGMHFGEGTIDCLKRELIEECGQEIQDIGHFYTTDFYQKALFYDDCQLISIYYLAKIKGTVNFKISEKPFDFEEKVNGNQSFRWVSADQIVPEQFTFPVDKHVARMLKAYLLSK
jgi:8-oxo-dGTP pyrophosphatase MutT (NUDIX family)